MTRSARSVATLALVALLGPRTVAAQEPLPCRVVESNPVSQELECRPGVADAQASMRLTAQFSGSHDDTRASLAATLDGAPVACKPGSKTATQGEDGDVTLECRFSVPGKAAAAPLLRVTLTWYHAQYVGFDLKRD